MGNNELDAAFQIFDFSKVREDPFNRVHRATLRDAKPSGVKSEEFGSNAFYEHVPEKKKSGEDIRPPRHQPKIHPLLVKWASTRPNDIEEIIINFRDTIRIPRFPEPIAEEERSSLANQQVRQQTLTLIAKIKAQRAQEYAVLKRQLETQYGASVLETFWLLKGVFVKMPLSQVKPLSSRDDVLYVEPRYGGTTPPANSDPNDDVDDGRSRLQSDLYFALGLSGGSVALLDTGVTFTHTQFGPNVGLKGDCVNGGLQCDNTTNPLFDSSDGVLGGHGTSSAAILMGNANLGPAFRGVTASTLDSFKVYEANNQLDTLAAKHAFERAVDLGDRVIVAEMQDIDLSETSVVCTAADNAFDAGAVVIAANGNNGSATIPGSVNGPALAHKVIGVGAFNVVTQAQFAFQSRGPAPDNRIKPDIQAPTGAETASNSGSTALKNFGGTSGAAPFAGGAALLLRNWLRGTSASIDPGQVYAFLILCGQNPSLDNTKGAGFDNTKGAGPLRLPTNGFAWWGKVTIQPGQTCDIVLDLGVAKVINFPNTVNVLDAALWWPEDALQNHNDVDLYLLDQANTVRARSISIPSVFERARAIVLGTEDYNSWTLRIRGENVLAAQTVYWAALAHSVPLPIAMRARILLKRILPFQWLLRRILPFRWPLLTPPGPDR
jgi:hypothetical protein